MIIEGLIVARHATLKGALRLKIFTEKVGPVVGCSQRGKAASNFMEGSYVQGTVARMGALPFWSLEIVQDPVFLEIVGQPEKLIAWRTALELCDCLCEGMSALETYAALLQLRSALSDEEQDWRRCYLQFELSWLRNMGYGLSLRSCVVTKSKSNLKYISPKTGCAVVEEVGRRYEAKLLPYPDAFSSIFGSGQDLKESEFAPALKVLSFFIRKVVKRQLLRNNLHEILAPVR